MKKASIGASSVVGVTIILSAFCSAGPAQAAYACWDSAYGHHCRDFGESAAGHATVRSVDHPTFTGILRQGETLSSYPGEWDGARTLKYQWLRGGLAVPGAVGETYQITGADAGRSLALRVTASAEGLKDGVETTLPSPDVAETNTNEYTARPGITGEAPEIEGSSRVGFTLEVDNLGTWSPSQLTVMMQWQADGVDIPGATGDNYKIRSADLGKRVTLKVTAGSSGVSTSNIAPVVTAGYIDPGDEQYLSGGSTVGDTLSVATLGKWYAGSEAVSFLYQWMRDGQPITGATSSTYVIEAADAGREIHAEVTGIAPGYAPNAQTTYFVAVDGDTEPTPVPSVPATPVPTPTPTPVPPTPTPTPTVTPTPSIPTPTPTRVPTPATGVTAVSPPEAESATAQNSDPAPAGEGSVQPQSAGTARTPVAGSGTAAAAVDAPAEAPAKPAEATATPPVTAAATPTAAASPAPSSSQGPAIVTAPASSAEGYNPLPLALPILGVLLAIGLAWFVRPIRAAVIRLVGRQAK